MIVQVPCPPPKISSVIEPKIVIVIFSILTTGSSLKNPMTKMASQTSLFNSQGEKNKMPHPVLFPGLLLPEPAPWLQASASNPPESPAIDTAYWAPPVGRGGQDIRSSWVEKPSIPRVHQKHHTPEEKSKISQLQRLGFQYGVYMWAKVVVGLVLLLCVCFWLLLCQACSRQCKGPRQQSRPSKLSHTMQSIGFKASQPSHAMLGRYTSSAEMHWCDTETHLGNRSHSSTSITCTCPPTDSCWKMLLLAPPGIFQKGLFADKKTYMFELRIWLCPSPHPLCMKTHTIS